MSNGKTRLITLALATAVLAAQLSAAAPGAMLYATGNVQVNGNAVTRSQAVFSGDRIETAGGSGVTLASNGSSVIVDGNSSVMFSNNSLSLTSGTIAIKTAQGMSARVGNLLVSPANGTARFKLAQSGNMINVFAMEGGLKISDGSKSIDLAAGKALTTSSAAQGGGTGGGGGGGVSGVVWVTVIVATIVGGIITYVVTRKPASPNVP